MLFVASKGLRSTQRFSVPRTRAIRSFPASRVQSVNWSECTNKRGPAVQGIAEPKETRQLSTVRKEVSLASQEGHTGLVSYVLYVRQSSSTIHDGLRLTKGRHTGQPWTRSQTGLARVPYGP